MEPSNADVVQVRTYRKRYLIVLITFAAFLVSSYQVSLYVASTKTMAAYYQVSDVDVVLTSTVFALVYATTAYPFSLMMESIGIKNSFVLATFCSSLGACIKCLAVEPGHFWMIVVGQTINAVGFVFLFGSGMAVAATWCDAKEVATVNALAYGIPGISSAVNFLLQSVLFGKASNTHVQLAHLTTVVAVAATSVFLITVVFMEEKPPTPPSVAQLSRSSRLTESNTIQLLSSRNYLLITLSFAMAQLILITLGVCANNIVLTTMPDGYAVLSAVGILMSLAGVVGAFAFGKLLDSTKRFKRIAIVGYVCTLLALCVYLISFYVRSLSTLYISSALVGFTFSGFGAVAIDTMIELTYPFPEIRSVALMSCIATALATPVPIICTKLFTAIGILHTISILVGISILGLALLLCVKWDLKRQAVENKHTSSIVDQINDAFVYHNDQDILVIN